MRRRAGAVVALSALVVASCGHEPVSAPVHVPEFTPLDMALGLRVPDELQALELRTYDGSGESVHPDFLSRPDGWNANLLYLVVTPYPNGRTTYENPSLYAGTDGVSWGAAPSAPMPLAMPQAGYLSDPDLSYDPATRELVLYYRQASSNDQLFMMRSRDGAVWGKPVAVVTAGASAALSPAVVRRNSGEWLMWTVNGAPGGCNGKSTTVELRRSMNGAVWSAPEKVTLPVSAGQFVWHIDVQWIPELHEYWALFPVKAPGTCATKALFMATSPDGKTWKTAPAPVIMAGIIPEFRDVVYRSTFAYNAANDEVSLWYSGARLAGSKRIMWRMAVQRRSRSDLFRDMQMGTEEIPEATAALSAAFKAP